MKEKILKLIISILSDFNVSYDSWKNFERVINDIYLENMNKATIKE